MNDLKSRLEAKRDSIAKELDGDMLFDSYSFNVGANEFIPLVVELAEILEAYSRNRNSAERALAKLNSWLGGGSVISEAEHEDALNFAYGSQWGDNE